MGNHFHLLLETPEPNLVTGMKWLLSTYGQGWNRTHMRRGHVFQGRYKAVPVNTSDSDTPYFMALVDYIHLNPARAGVAGGDGGRIDEDAMEAIQRGWYLGKESFKDKPDPIHCAGCRGRD